MPNFKPPGSVDQLAVVLPGIQRGDLIYGCGSGPTSTLIRKLTKHHEDESADWSHVGLFVGGTDPSTAIVDVSHIGCGYAGVDTYQEAFTKLGWSRVEGVDVERLVAQVTNAADADAALRAGDRPSLLKKSRFGYADLGLAAAVMIRARLRQLKDIVVPTDYDFDAEPPQADSSGLFRWRAGGDLGGHRVCAGFVFAALRDNGADLDLTWPAGVRVTSDGMYVFDSPTATPLDQVSLGHFLWNGVSPNGTIRKPEFVPDTFSGTFRTIDTAAIASRAKKLRFATSHLLYAAAAAPHIASFLDPRKAMPVEIAIGPNELWTAQPQSNRWVAE